MIPGIVVISSARKAADSTVFDIQAGLNRIEASSRPIPVLREDRPCNFRCAQTAQQAAERFERHWLSGEFTMATPQDVVQFQLILVCRRFDQLKEWPPL